MADLLKNRKHLLVTFVSVIVCFAYVYYRYLIYGDVSFIHMPAYLSNKAFAFCAVLFLFYAGLGLIRANYPMLKYWGKVSFHFAILHCLISLALFNSKQYLTLFDYQAINLKGELLILFGSLAAYCYWLLYRTSNKTLRLYLFIISCLCIALHLISLGLTAWLQLSFWFSGPPSVSILSFILVIATLAITIVNLPSSKH